MDLNELLVFAKVAQAGSFVGAARELGMPKSTVSRKVAELETRLGARLLQRTTRKLSLTDAGQAYYRHAARIVEEIEQAERAVTLMEQAPRGLLRLTIPLNFGFLAPMVATFMQRYPEVRLELVGADRVVDLVEEGFDLAVRAGALRDSSLIARPFGELRHFLVASPEFLRHAGTPRAPRDLSRFDCLVFGAGAGRTTWHLTQDGVTEAVRVRRRLLVNDLDFLQEATRAGLGIATMPLFRCIDDLRARRLRRVLPEWRTPSVPLHAVYPSTRHLSPKVKAFVDHLREQMTPPPWERGPVPAP